MLVFNQQANIKNVNGAIADVFANRPAPQSTFYLFYSTDTQEIFYDNGAWILLGTGGGATNIYNSDGTLTNNRILNGDNNFLVFQNLNEFFVQATNGIGSVFYISRNFHALQLFYETGSGVQRRGLRQEFYNSTPEGLNLILGDNTQAHLRFNYNQNIVGFSDSLETNPANWIGLQLDFTNKTYSLGDPFSFNNTTYLVIDDNNQTIKTGNNAGVNGIEIDFVTGNSNFGLINNANPSYINLQSGLIQTIYSGASQGFRLDFTIETYEFGNGAIGNQTNFVISDPNSIIRSVYQGNDIGLKLDFLATNYFFGDFNATNNGAYLLIQDTARSIELNASNNFNNTTILIDDFNQLIKTQYQFNDIGLKIDFANTLYEFGQLTGGNETRIEIFDATGLINVKKSGGVDGLQLSLNSSIYKFGNLTGTNNTYIQIEDLATYPLQINGTNISSGSAGGSSGQHLKVKINGVDYKIKLENP
jgi:hypothetical protein